MLVAASEARQDDIRSIFYHHGFSEEMQVVLGRMFGIIGNPADEIMNMAAELNETQPHRTNLDFAFSLAPEYYGSVSNGLAIMAIRTAMDS